ncbi:ABC transporter substrate-binding protein [Nitratireductor soli]|uniref:ABC transporter substrate-binding protein n=1 Tax=Nitratireductor soli TaxID=1670619 RepID=UPI0009E1E6BE|nr:ABC transporter substrate-binding protein [Nitratireductor soli]
MDYNRIRLAVAGVLAGALALCASPALANDKLRVGLSSDGLLFVPAFVADVMGYYEEEGLDVDLTILGGATKVYAALVSGEVEFSVSSSVSILRGRAGGTDMTMVGAAMDQHASNIVATREWFEKAGLTKDSTYEERLKALDGITIAVASAAGGSAQLVRFLAGEAGVDAERDMTLTVLGVGDTTLAAFARRRVDAITHSSPVAVQAIREFDGVMLFHMSGGQVPAYNGFLYLTYTGRESWIREHEDQTARFLRAMQKAHKAIRDPALADVVRDKVHAKYHAKIDDALYADAWADYASAFPESIEISGEMVDRVNELAAKVENADPVLPEHVAAAWTNDYAARVVKSLNAD